MMSLFNCRTLRIALVIGVLGLIDSLPAQVSEWHFFKEIVYQQDASNTMPTAPSTWLGGVWIVTSAAGDAGLITISGGNILGSIALEHDGNGDWFLEREYGSHAAMNAELPSNSTYTLTISGGTLGLLIQSFVVGPEQYPNTPYLTGSSLATAQQFPSGTATTLTWNQPGPLTQASGSTIFGIEDRDGDELYFLWATTAVMSDTIPASTLNADACHSGWLEFTSDTTVAAGGFGIAGTVHHARALDFEVRTWPFPTAPCARQVTSGVGCDGLEIQCSDPILGSNWTLTTNGITGATPLAFTYFSLAPQNPSLPLSALGLGSPSCSLYIDPLTIVTNLGGLAPTGQLNLTIPIPATQNLGGMLLFTQSIALTSITPLGLSSSNVIEAMLGN